MVLSRRGFVAQAVLAGAAGCALHAPLSFAQPVAPDGTNCSGADSKDWTLGPFQRVNEANPCLAPTESGVFYCPVSKEEVHWENKDVICAAAAVRNGKVNMLYRAEGRAGGLAGKTGQGWGTSRIGLASSEDGIHFNRYLRPVLYPDNDFMNVYEWDGGCQDPRVVEDQSGTYYMTYTAFDGKTGRLAIASSSDLFHWKKHGLVFDKAFNGEYRDRWTKSGAIVVRREGTRFIAARINGRYWMYYLEGRYREGIYTPRAYVATSENFVDWEPVRDENDDLVYAIAPRKGFFDSQLTEPGPFGLLTDKGIVLIYNGAYLTPDPHAEHHHLVFAAGQALMDSENPIRALDRTNHDFFHPQLPWELQGQVSNVVFLESLAFFRGQWFIYYGAADSRIGVARYIPRV